MFSATFADQSAVVTVVTRGADNSATRTQIAIVTKIFFATGAIVAHTAVGANIIVTLRTTFSATGTQIGAI